MTAADYATLSFRMPGRGFEDSVSLPSGAAQTKLEETYQDSFYPMDPIVDEAQVAGRPYSLDQLLAAAGHQNPAPIGRFSP
jgi:hypothetical protein